MITVYVSIGNSDDKLTQVQWAEYVERVNNAIRYPVDVQVHGWWFSHSVSQYQNTCWCFEVASQSTAMDLQEELTIIRSSYGQDSVAWAVVSGTEFI